jgi:phosphatidylinositol alpha-1,6-mannosyltransferase
LSVIVKIAPNLESVGDDAAAKRLVLHPSVDSDVFIPANKNQTTLSNLGWSNKNLVLTVDRLQARKDQDMMFNAVVGDGAFKDELINLVEELKLHNYVQFLSEISDQEMINCYQQ